SEQSLPGRKEPSESRAADLTVLRDWLAKLRAQDRSPERPDPGPEGSAATLQQPHGPPTTLVVAPTGPADCTTVTQAIRKASPNARILVRPGRYEEGMVLDKPLEIVGDGPR